MGNKQEKESSKVNFEDCKKEYFKAVNKDMKESMKKINTTLNLEKCKNFESDNWVDYLKQKFNEYCYNNKIENKQFQQIFYYLNNIGETNETKHIYNLSIFLKKYFEGEVKIKQKNSNGIIDTYYTNTEMDNEKVEEKIELTKDTIIWRGSEFIFEDIEKIDHPLTSFIKYLGFFLSEIYEKEFEKVQSNVMDQEAYQKSIVYNENNAFRKSNINSNLHIKSECSMEETSEDDNVYTNKKDRNEKNYKSALFVPSDFYNQNKDLEDFFKQLKMEILFISNILTGALIRFYKIKNCCNEKILGIFLEKIKDVFIRNDLYRVIFEIKSSLLLRKKNQFSANLIKLYNLKPHYFSTSPYFSQDREFRKFFRKKMKELFPNKHEDKKTFSKEENTLENFKNIKRKSYCKNLNSNLKWNYPNHGSNKIFDLEELKLRNYDSALSKNILKIPFDETLLLLRKLGDCTSMLQRIDLMFMLRSTILNEIDNFWINIPLKMKYKSVDADNLLSIFIYLIIKSQMTNLIIDIDIIDCFLSRNIKLSRKGYFFSLFQSSIEYIIENINLDQLDINIKEYDNFKKTEINKLHENPFAILDIDDFNLNNKVIENFEEKQPYQKKNSLDLNNKQN